MSEKKFISFQLGLVNMTLCMSDGMLVVAPHFHLPLPDKPTDNFSLMFTMWGRIKTSMSSVPRWPLSPDHKQTENNLWKQQAGQSGLVFKFLTVVDIWGQDAACLHVNKKTATSAVQNLMPNVCHFSSLLWIKELLSNFVICLFLEVNMRS